MKEGRKVYASNICDVCVDINSAKLMERGAETHQDKSDGIIFLCGHIIISSSAF